jgi:hypothetical protein
MIVEIKSTLDILKKLINLINNHKKIPVKKFKTEAMPLYRNIKIIKENYIEIIMAMMKKIRELETSIKNRSYTEEMIEKIRHDVEEYRQKGISHRYEIIEYINVLTLKLKEKNEWDSYIDLFVTSKNVIVMESTSDDINSGVYSKLSDFILTKERPSPRRANIVTITGNSESSETMMENEKNDLEIQKKFRSKTDYENYKINKEFLKKYCELKSLVDEHINKKKIEYEVKLEANSEDINKVIREEYSFTTTFIIRRQIHLLLSECGYFYDERKFLDFYATCQKHIEMINEKWIKFCKSYAVIKAEVSIL